MANHRTLTCRLRGTQPFVTKRPVIVVTLGHGLLRPAWRRRERASCLPPRCPGLLAGQGAAEARCATGGAAEDRCARRGARPPQRPHFHLLCTPTLLQALRSLIQSCKSQQWRSKAALDTAPSATGTQGDAAAPGYCEAKEVQLMQIWHLHEVQDRSSGVGPEGQRELRPSFASPGVCMCLTAMSSCRVNNL